MTVLVLSIAIAFFFSFTCSLMEATLLSLTPGQIAEITKRNPGIGAIWNRFKNDIEPPITAILTLNTFAHTIGATIAGAEFAILYKDVYIGIFSVIFTYLMLQFTEILPKTLGVRFNVQLAYVFAYIIPVMMISLKPVIVLVRTVNSVFEIGKKKASSHLEELTALAQYARLSRQISPQQEKIILGAAKLSVKNAKEIMIPAEQVTFLSDAQSLSQAVIVAHLDPHTRFPIMAGNDINNVIGYINFKELVYRIRTNPVDPTVKGIIRTVHFVTEKDTCDRILKAFVDEHIHMAIVKAADGATLGLITMEDVVEELIGNIEDEFDKLPRMCHSLNKGVWIVGGGIKMDLLSEKLEIPSIKGDMILSDWTISKIGHVPAANESLYVDNLEFSVRRIRRFKVFEVLISPKHLNPKIKKQCLPS